MTTPQLDKIAEDQAAQMGAAMTNKLFQAVEEVGNVVNAKEHVNAQAAWLATFRKIEMGFDADGNHNLTIMMNPETADRVTAQMKAWEDDPEFIRELNEIIEQQRKDWNDREGRRKLVD